MLQGDTGAVPRQAPKGSRMALHPDNEWFYETFHEEYRIILDACHDPVILLKPKGRPGHVRAWDVGVLAVWIHGTRRANVLQETFPDLKRVQRGDTEHVFLWSADHPDTDAMLAKAGAYRRPQLSPEQRERLSRQAREVLVSWRPKEKGPKTVPEVGVAV